MRSSGTGDQVALMDPQQQCPGCPIARMHREPASVPPTAVRAARAERVGPPRPRPVSTMPYAYKDGQGAHVTDSPLQSVPGPLLEELSHGRWLPIVGAGFSKNAEMRSGSVPPDWKELGTALARHVPGLQHESPLDAISAYEQEFGRVALVDVVNRLLGVHDAQPGRAHAAFARLGFQNVVTTNFDMLLERAYDNISRPCLPLVEEFQLSARNPYPGPRLLKLHGDVHHPQRLVLTEADYDQFLQANPILATSLGALLIDHTAILIGYSLDDPDMRQLLSLIKARLGKLARPMWTIQVNCAPHVISRYARRNVRVINLPHSDGISYGDQLAGLFDALRNYWNTEVIEESQSTNERALADLQLPAPSSRVCYFAVPLELLGLYREFIFPIVERYGLVPVAARDVLTPPGTESAKIDALIDRAVLVVVDTSGRHALYEAGLAVRKTSPDTVLLIADEEASLPDQLTAYRVLRRRSDWLAWPDLVSQQFEALLREIMGSRTDRQMTEPERLLNANEFRAAIIAAISLLEVELARHFDDKKPKDFRPSTIRTLTNYAEEIDLIMPDERREIDSFLRLRNEAVHRNVPVTRQQATTAVRIVQQIVGRLHGEPGSSS